jgi:hypothetical protein
MKPHVLHLMLSPETPSSQYPSSLEFSAMPLQSYHQERFALRVMNSQCSRYYYASVTYIEKLSGVLVTVVDSD